MKEKHFCMCCLTEECYKDMGNIYYIGNKTENYFDMLINIFNIKILIKDTHRCLICEDCVTKLRDAAAFKTQILNTQETLSKNLCWNDNSTDSLHPNIVAEPGYDDFDDFDDTLSDNFNDSDFVWDDCTPSRNQKAQVLVIKLESMQEKTQNLPKNAIPNSNSQQKSNKTEIINDGNIQNTSSISTEQDGATVATNSVACLKNANNCEGVFTDDSASNSTNNLRRKCRMKKTKIHDSLEKSCDSNTDMDTKKIIPTFGTSLDDSPHSSTKITRVMKLKNKSITAIQCKGKINRSKPNQQNTPETHSISKYKRENTLKLVLNSNLCLFRSFQNKYGCMYCSTKFPEFNKLREHSLTHSNPKPLVRKVNGLRGLSCKNAEISNLKCIKCEANCSDLLELINHLNNEHEISFHGTEHYLVPYKLQNGFQCIACDSKFKSYLRLSIHMNSHYTNNVCEKCGVSFINRLGLRAHMHSMHKEKKCSHCPAVFLTNALKTKHLRQAHNFQNWKRYCNLCDQQFRYTYLLEEHKIQEHGFKRQLSSCPECGKNFFSAANLKIHFRSVHIRERNHPCSKCCMRFFTKCDQKRHERTHEDIRSFSCTYCEAKFKSKDSWRRHLKRQHGHAFGEAS